MISRDNPKWEHWIDRGATELLLIANLPGSRFPQGPSDPRRVFIPLDKNVWRAEGGTIQIEVQGARWARRETCWRADVQ
jgi:hypothetical protein